MGLAEAHLLAQHGASVVVTDFNRATKEVAKEIGGGGMYSKMMLAV